MPLVPVPVQRRNSNPCPLPEQHGPDDAVDSFHDLPPADDELKGSPPIFPRTFYYDAVGTATTFAAAAATDSGAAAVAPLKSASVVNAGNITNHGPSSLLVPFEDDLVSCVINTTCPKYAGRGGQSTYIIVQHGGGGILVWFVACLSFLVVELASLSRRGALPSGAGGKKAVMLLTK